MDAGVILIVTAIGLRQSDLELIKTAVNPDQIETIWVGDELTSDIAVDLQLGDDLSLTGKIGQLKILLRDKGIIFKPW